MPTDNSKNQYSADSIQALEGMEHVRKRPSMYIGDAVSYTHLTLPTILLV